MRQGLGVVLAAIVCSAALTAHGAADERVIDTQQSTVMLRVFKAGLFAAFADNHLIEVPIMEGSLGEDPAAPHLQISFDARRLRVLDPGLSVKDRQDVQVRMLGADVLDVSRFPFISYHSLTTEPRGPGGWRVNGELDLRGRIRPLSMDAVSKNGRFTGSVTFRQSDFGIVPISIIGGTVKVKDEVTIEFDIAIIKGDTAVTP